MCRFFGDIILIHRIEKKKITCKPQQKLQKQTVNNGSSAAIIHFRTKCREPDTRYKHVTEIFYIKDRNEARTSKSIVKCFK